ncbi:MAG: hydantoinase/oxoprolinase family protein [Longimicrobiales bacterium]
MSESLIAVDTGGTFTDVVCVRGGRLWILKVLSTPDDPARAVLTGIRQILADSPGRDRRTTEVADAERTDPAADPGFTLIHGSTVATNALLERRGGRVALVTNAGFEDLIEIGRQNRPQLYALVGERLPPLVAPPDRHGIRGRLGPRGEVLEPLDEAELSALAGRLRAAESIAICLLHSYAASEHEERIAAVVRELGLPISISSRLLPEYREYERTATTVVNAYVAPTMERYLGRLEHVSGARRVRIMGSAGGALALERARHEPAHTVLSGPAGGVIGALTIARNAGFDEVLTFDMGGTSTDVSLCIGRPQLTRDFTIAGLPVALPMLDIHTVGAGGGSIAWRDAGGALRVGPRSAGAVPGPIAYGRGGTDLTVTDANLWLGRLPVDAFLGGARRLDRELIAAPLRGLAQALGVSDDEAAAGVVEVVNVAMEGALRVISVERGHDPRGFTLVPFGGAAGLHAVELAQRLGIPRVLVPPDPGVLSAFGMLVSPISRQSSRTVLIVVRPDERVAALDAPFAALEADARQAMTEEGVPDSAISIERIVDARYAGQSYELPVPARDWVEAFQQAHHARYGYSLPQESVEAVTLRVVATSPPADVALPELRRADSEPSPADAPCDVAHAGAWISAARFDRATLLAGHRLTGPAIVTEYSATTWLPPGWLAEVRRDGALLLSPERSVGELARHPPR